MDNSFDDIARTILESVQDRWTVSEQEVWTEMFKEECLENVLLPAHIQMTAQRLHPSIVIACHRANLPYMDIIYSPHFKPAIFYVFGMREYIYYPEGEISTMHCL